MKQQRPSSLSVVCIFFIQDQAFAVGKQFECDKPAFPSETKRVSVAVTVEGFDMVLSLSSIFFANAVSRAGR